MLRYGIQAPSSKIKLIPTSVQVRTTAALTKAPISPNFRLAQTSYALTVYVLCIIGGNTHPFSFRSMPIQWSRNELGPLQLRFFFFFYGRCREMTEPQVVLILAPNAVYRATSVHAGSIQTGFRPCGLLRSTLQSLIPPIGFMLNPLRLYKYPLLDAGILGAL